MIRNFIYLTRRNARIFGISNCVIGFITYQNLATAVIHHTTWYVIRYNFFGLFVALPLENDHHRRVASKLIDQLIIKIKLNDAQNNFHS